MPISEYDAFGPWVYEITPEHPAPGLFVPFLPQEPSIMQIKIPRSIERRRASPDMDLYDHAAGICADFLWALRREGQEVRSQRIPLSQVQCLSFRRHLLSASLTVYGEEDSLFLPFNAVSMDMMEQFAARLRSAVIPEQPLLSPDDVAGWQGPATLEPFFHNTLRDLRADGADPLLYAFQPERRDGMPAGLLRRETLPAALHVLTARELIVTWQEPRRRHTPSDAFKYRQLRIPLSRLCAVQTRDLPERREREQTVLLSGCSFSFGQGPENSGVSALYGTLRKLLSERSLT